MCSIPDPAGNPRLVTSAASYGQVVTETDLVIDRAPARSTRTAPTADEPPRQPRDRRQGRHRRPAIIAKWNTLSGAARRAGRRHQRRGHPGDSSGNRGIETPMGDLVADAHPLGHHGTRERWRPDRLHEHRRRAGQPARTRRSHGPRAPAQITYAEAYDVAPFGNLLTSRRPHRARRSRRCSSSSTSPAARVVATTLALGVSDGLHLHLGRHASPRAAGSSPGSMKLNGTPIDLAATYRVGTLNFLADGGDLFTAFTAGTNAARWQRGPRQPGGLLRGPPGPHRPRPTASPVSDRPAPQRGPHPTGVRPSPRPAPRVEVIFWPGDLTSPRPGG